ncbi:MAG: hypothetical protein DRI30_06385 [Chloroflexi bacterium]|nr:MAG: hypothetical protein DRI30_06385 [Chloroflexota bacterium]
MNKAYLNHKFSLPGLILTVGVVIWAGLGLQGCGDGDGFFKDLTLCGVNPEAFISSQSRIGGSSTVITLDRADNWALYNVANELRATQVGVTESAKYTLTVAGFIQDIDVVEYPASSGAFYALLSMGDKGISVVNVTDPTNMLPVLRVDVNYEQTGIPWADGGGNVSLDNTISGVHAPISSLEVYDDGVETHLLIANTAYGLHKTLLANIFDTAAGREADGTLLINSETYTLQYAGENPWGGPKSLTLYRDGDDTKGKLFSAMGFLGMGIFDPDTLEQIGGYNLYTDVSSVEDWFIDNDVIEEVQSDYSNPGSGEGAPYACTGPCIDTFTGMPDYMQAAYEISVVWHGKNPCDPGIECAPWAAFDRYGKFYYNARKVDVATFDGQTTAYIAYALGGMVGVDVTGYKTAGPYDPGLSNPFANFRKGNRQGYAAAVPAHGPDAPTGEQSKSLFPYFGAGMLKESGIVDVKVDIAGNRVFFTDHFAGLIVISNASNPASWHSTHDLGVPYDNDTLPGPGGGAPVLGDHWPDYEFITSYDMSPHDATDNESLPEWLYQSPTLLLSGEVSGHGNSFALMPTMDVANPDQVDVIMASGGGGISFIDITNLTGGLPDKDGFTVPVHMATTDEVYREADGTTSIGASIGHSAGVTAYRNLLFLADGPHGMTVWQIADADRCFPTDEVHLLANTLQDEYPVDTGTEVINPTPHAYDVVLDVASQKAYVLSQSRGLRRVGTSAVSTEEIPVLLQTELSDIYEHNTDDGTSVGGMKMQDHAYDVALDGNLAFVADGSNGLTVYDVSKDPTVDDSYFVGNIGGLTKGKPLLGHATAVKLWLDTSNANNPIKYAFVAAGHAGIGVVDVTDAANMVLIKVFEPIKTEYHEEDDGVITAQYNKADGKSVDVLLVDDHAYFTYDSFGVLAYKIVDLIKPLPVGMDPTDIWERGEIGERPIAVARFKLQDPLLFGSADLAELGGGAQGMFFLKTGGKHLFYVAYDSAGIAKIDWTDVANPVLVQHADTAGNASDVEVANGRVYVADGGGGLVLMK